MKVLRLGLLLVGLSALSITTALVLAAPADPPVAPPATLAALPSSAVPALPLRPYARAEVLVPTARGDRPGTLLLPSDPGRHPAVVMVAGAGTGSRSGLLPTARALAARGAAVLLYDRPTVRPGEQVAWVADRFLQQHGLEVLRRLVTLQLSLGQPHIGYAGFRPPLDRVRQPVLALFGADDPTMPVASAVALLRERLPHPPTVQVYASAGHALTVDGDHPPGFGDRIGQWVTRSGDSDLRQNLVEAEVRQDVAVPGQDPPGVAVQALLVASGPVGAVGSALLVLGAVRSLGRKRNPLGPLPLRQPDHLSRSTS